MFVKYCLDFFFSRIFVNLGKRCKSQNSAEMIHKLKEHLICYSKYVGRRMIVKSKFSRCHKMHGNMKVMFVGHPVVYWKYNSVIDTSEVLFFPVNNVH